MKNKKASKKLIQFTSLHFCPGRNVATIFYTTFSVLSLKIPRATFSPQKLTCATIKYTPYSLTSFSTKWLKAQTLKPGCLGLNPDWTFTSYGSWTLFYFQGPRFFHLWNGGNNNLCCKWFLRRFKNRACHRVLSVSIIMQQCPRDLKQWWKQPYLHCQIQSLPVTRDHWSLEMWSVELKIWI